MKNKKYISIPQLAKLLNISRIAVYKKVKKGEIKAIRIGRNFAIPTKAIKPLLKKIKSKDQPLTEQEKQEIDKVVDKTIKEYGETLRLLGDE